MVQRRAIKLTFVRCSLRAIGVVLVTAAALVSCGDEQDDSQRAAATPGDPELVVRRYFAAFARGDGAAACALMTDVARQGLRQLPEGERAGSCERAAAVLKRDSLPVSRPNVGDLQISGRTATARVTSEDPQYSTDVLLRREGRGWKIAYPPAVVSRFKTPPGIRPHDDEHKDRE